MNESDEGDTVADMLQTRFRDQVKETDLEAGLQSEFLEEFAVGLYGYTYLEYE